MLRHVRELIGMTAIVTGAAGRVGNATAKALVREGVQVVHSTTGAGRRTKARGAGATADRARQESTT